MVVAIAICLILSFLFAGSETAITSMGDARLRRLHEEGRGPKKLFALWQHDHGAVLSTLLAGNTAVNILASALTTALAIDLAQYTFLPPWVAEHTVGFGVFGLTLAVLVAGEIAPKTLAKSHPEWFLRPLHLVWWFHVPTYRFTKGLTWLARRFIRLLGVDTSQNGFVVTEAEIEDMVRIGSEEGSIEADRGEILQNVFELWEVSVRSIMTPRTQVCGLDVGASLQEVLEVMEKDGFSRYPVFNGSPDNVEGIFYAKSMVGALDSRDEQPFDLKALLAPAMFVPETQKASHILQLMKTRKTHMAVVVDEHGGTSGIVTLEDVLEELVGEIYDEYDEIERHVEATGPNTWVVDASAEIRDLEETLAFALPASETYATLGGWVVEALGEVPVAGASFDWEDVHVTVLEADDKRPLRVELARVERVERPEVATTTA